MFGLFKRTTTGLALGAGGAKGFAHIGVLKSLENARFPINIITGASAGALVGAMYAQSGSIDKVESRMRDFLATDFIERNKLDMMIPAKERERHKMIGLIGYYIKQQFILARSFTRMSFFNSEMVEEALSFLLDDTDIKETKIPFGAIAVDYLSGERVLITKGSIRKAVAASGAIPGVFPPVPWNGMQLVDGSVISKVPIIEAREIGANFVIGVNVSPEIKEDLHIHNGLELMFRADEITGHHLNRQNIEQADILIHPDLGRIHWADFNNMDGMIKIGKTTTGKLLPDIKLKLKRKKLYFRRI